MIESTSFQNIMLCICAGLTIIVATLAICAYIFLGVDHKISESKPCICGGVHSKKSKLKELK